MASSGRSFGLLRSKITRDGCFSRTRATIISGFRSKKIGAPIAFAVVEIFTENIRSSTAHKTIGNIIGDSG